MENDNSDEQLAVFDLELEDSELIQTIKKPFKDSQKFWASDDFDLDERRERNIKLWKGEHYDGVDMYDHNVPYVDNVIFPSVESAVPISVAQIPQIEVMPAGDSVTQVQLSRDLEKVGKRWAELQEFEDKMASGVRDVMLKYVAVFKLRWDENKGTNGEIIFEHLEPGDVVVDHNAGLYENPRFVGHKQKMTVEEMIIKFPEKEDEILDHFEIKQKRVTQMTANKELWEVWFTYYDDEGHAQEAVAWLLDWSLVLGKMTDPNWIEEDKKRMNFLDSPCKPFFFMNVYNDGTRKIDNNAAIDQAYHQQKIVNKRGRQIVENADQSGSGIVYNTEMIGKEDMAKLIGAPDEKVGVTGNVNNAFARMSPPLLPQYVVEDKFDARARIENYFGAHDVTQGRGGSNRTATQDVLQAEKDNSRQSPVVRAIERTSRQIFRFWLQMVKVYYTEKHFFTVVGANGQFDKIALESDDIEDGIDVMIIKGSTLPIDKAANRELAQQGATLGYADPLTYWEVMQTGVMPQPKVIVERLVDWAADQGKFVQGAIDEEFNREAMTDIKILNAGKMPKVRSEPSQQYLDFRKKYMLGGDFQDLKEDIQKAHVKNLRENLVNAQRILSLMQTQLMGAGEEGKPFPMGGGGMSPLSPMNPGGVGGNPQDLVGQQQPIA